MEPSEQVCIVCCEIPDHHSRKDRATRTYGVGDLVGDVLLNAEKVARVSMVGLRPNVIAGPPVIQLHRDAQFLFLPLLAAFEDGADLQLLRNRPTIPRLSLELERGGAGHDSQSFQVGNGIGQFFGQAIAEILILRVGRQVDERQDYQRVHAIAGSARTADSVNAVKGKYSGRRRDAKGSPDPPGAESVASGNPLFLGGPLGGFGHGNLFYSHQEAVSAPRNGLDVISVPKDLA